MNRRNQGVLMQQKYIKRRVTRKRLAQIWCELNKHEIPKELQGKSRHGFVFKSDSDAHGAMHLIESFLGWKEIAPEWNKTTKKKIKTK